MGFSSKEQHHGVRYPGVRRPRCYPSSAKVHNHWKLRLSHHHIIDFVPAPQSVMANQQPERITILPNGTVYREIPVRVSYTAPTTRNLISLKVVTENNIKYTGLTGHGEQEGNIKLIGYFKCCFWPGEGSPETTTDRDVFWVTSDPLRGQVDVLWKQTYPITSNARTTRGAYPAKLGRTAEQKKDDDGKTKEAEKKRKREQEEANKKIIREHENSVRKPTP